MRVRIRGLAPQSLRRYGRSFVPGAPRPAQGVDAFYPQVFYCVCYATMITNALQAGRHIVRADCERMQRMPYYCDEGEGDDKDDDEAERLYNIPWVCDELSHLANSTVRLSQQTSLRTARPVLGVGSVFEPWPSTDPDASVEGRGPTQRFQRPEMILQDPLFFHPSRKASFCSHRLLPRL